MHKLFDFVILGLAIARLSSLFSREEGVFEIFTKLRTYLGVYEIELLEGNFVLEANSQLGKMIKCYWCNSIWIATFVWIVYKQNKQFALSILTPMALSMFSIHVNNKNSL